MKFFRLFSVILLSAFIVICISNQNVFAQETKESIKELTSPYEIQKFRQEFIENFKRTGLNTTVDDAAFLRIMVESTGAKRGIEVGSFTGFGAINMGMGFERTGGHLYTIEIDSDIAEECRENIRKMGLEKTVTCITGDALEVIPKLEGKYDFVFIDAVKQDYFKYFKDCLPMLEPGAVIVADNVIKYANPMRDFLDFMENDPDYDMVILQASEEKGDGMALIYKLK